MPRYSHSIKASGGLRLSDIAFGATLLGLAGVVSANLLARATLKDDLTIVAVARSNERFKGFADSAPTPRHNGVMTVSRSVGVDGTSTATIPGAASLGRCNDARITITRSVVTEAAATGQTPANHCETARR
jgi:hypothetical protein